MNCTIHALMIIDKEINLTVSSSSMCSYANYHAAQAVIFGMCALLLMLYQGLVFCVCDRTDPTLIILFVCLTLGCEGLAPFAVYYFYCRQKRRVVRPTGLATPPAEAGRGRPTIVATLQDPPTEVEIAIVVGGADDSVQTAVVAV